MTAAGGLQVRRSRVFAVVDLVRAGTMGAGMCLCIIGARLGGGRAGGGRVAWAVACVGLLIAFAQVVNDIVDVDVDRLQKPQRPLVSGALTVRTATVMAWGLGAAGIGAGLACGPRLFAIAVVVLAASWGYSVWWKGTVGFGNAVVALLASSPIAFGAAAAHGADARVWCAQVVILLFMAAFEVLKAGRDLDGDAAAGLRTIATRYGLRTTYRVGALLCIGASLSAAVPVLFSDRRIGYLVVMGAGAVAPTTVAAWRLLRSGGSAEDLAPSFALLRLAWFAGIASMAIL